MKKKQRNGKKLRRNQVKHPALDPRYNSRILREHVDYDYLDQLSNEELDWLNKFTEEYHKASYKHDGTDIQDYETYGKDSNDRNNAQNRCIYGNLRNKGSKKNKALSQYKLVNYDELTENLDAFENELSKDIDPARLEDAYIEYLESRELEVMFREYDAVMKDFTEEVVCTETVAAPPPGPSDQ